MTPEEKSLAEALGRVWNAYLALPEEYPTERAEFATLINQCLRHIAARVALRELNQPTPNVRVLEGEEALPHWVYARAALTNGERFHLDGRVWAVLRMQTGAHGDRIELVEVRS